MNTEDQNLILGALDSLGSALADHEHQWTEGERAIYEAAVELVQKAKSVPSLSTTPEASVLPPNGEIEKILNEAGMAIGASRGSYYTTAERVKHLADVKQYWYEQTDKARAEAASLLRDNQELRERLRLLKAYRQHGSNCDLVRDDGPVDEFPQCSCGLSGLVKEIDSALSATDELREKANES